MNEAGEGLWASFLDQTAPQNTRQFLAKHYFFKRNTL